MALNHPELDAFNAKLDADPSDLTTRLVMADWLDEHDQPVLAAGYRALGFAGIHPYRRDEVIMYLGPYTGWQFYRDDPENVRSLSDDQRPAVLPVALVGVDMHSVGGAKYGLNGRDKRRELEDSVAEWIGKRLLRL